MMGCLLVLPFLGCAQGGEGKEDGVRPAAVAGQFYPGGREALGAEVDRLLREAAPPVVPGRIRVLIVPHAGYVYSGGVAAYAYKRLSGQEVNTVVLLGDSHQEAFDGVAVYPSGAFQTPLGPVEVNASLCKRLIMGGDKVMPLPKAHVREHSLEVQLPFLQRVLKKFAIVPVLFGAGADRMSETVAKALKDLVDERTLVVASSDLSHYPSDADARRVDGEVIKAIMTGDAGQFTRTLSRLRQQGVPNAVTFACGEQSIRAAMLLAAELDARKAILLKSANSSDASGDRNRVVGYAAIAFYDDGKTTGEARGKRREDDGLGKEEQKALLELAKQSVEGWVTSHKVPVFDNRWPALEKGGGAFVTLKKRGELRGCIGRFASPEPLYKVIIEMAISAATQDHRFPPVTAGELNDLRYEISVLSPLRRIKDWHEIRLGKHGVQVAKGFRSGVFLPQVATETGWDLETFMGTLCEQKAGLSRDAWKTPDVQLYVFTAQVF
ncbi:MAG: AmmeMemoRadiSam system protein B [Verrucomicrobiae bacterium]|nr:AmmeMemoRadiSam system protein B [Verrucomicrobiae bacterium]